MGLVLRKAISSDASAVADVYLASRKAFLAFAPSAHTDAEIRQWLAVEVIPTGRVTVAVNGTRVVGMMALQEGPTHRWIDHLYVHPHFVGQGVGARLLELALANLEPPIRLYTFQANTAARRFYERHGFRPIRFGDGSQNEERCPDILYELAN